MDLRQLRSFAAVAHEGTYAAAAASQAVSQPAVWRQVRELEEELGLPLFERYGRRVRPTADGRRLLEQAIAVLATVDRFAATAKDLRSVRAGVVGIACASPHLQRFLAANIGDFRSAHPGVAIVVREYGGSTAPGRGIREDLLDGVVDVATVVGPIDDSEVEGFPVYDVRLIVAVPDDHPWRDVGSVEVDLLRGESLILSPRGAYSRAALEAACGRAGFEPTVAFALASPVSQVALGRAGVGLPVAFDDSVGPDGGRPWPMLVEAGIPIGDTISLVWRVGAALTPSVTAFVDLAREASIRHPSRRQVPGPRRAARR